MYPSIKCPDHPQISLYKICAVVRKVHEQSGHFYKNTSPCSLPIKYAHFLSSKYGRQNRCPKRFVLNQSHNDSKHYYCGCPISRVHAQKFLSTAHLHLAASHGCCYARGYVMHSLVRNW